MTGERGGWNIAGYLERTAERFPERVAVCLPDGSSLTYRQLSGRARRVAGFLIDGGVSPGDRVGIVLPKSLEAVCAIYGALTAGAAYVPLDFAAPAAWVGGVLSDCGCRVAIVDSRCRELVADIAARMKVVVVGEEGEGGCEVPAHHSWTEISERGAIAGSMVTREPDDLAYILYTSGSTGQPKGVMLSHRNAATFVDWCADAFGITEHDRFGSHAPFCFSISIFDLFVCIRAGAMLCLIPEEMGRNPRLLVKFIVERQISIWKSTPAVLSLVIEFGAPHEDDLASIRLVIFGGSVFPIGQLRHLAGMLPRARIFNHWGCTETNGCIYARVPSSISEQRKEPWPLGFPSSHCSVLLLDEESGRESNETGMMYISSASVSLGYWNRPAETGAAFVWRSQKRWYRTGDIVRYDPHDGFIYVGRRDRMVKRRGNRIELGEIERALFAHPGLHEAAVVALPDSEEGARIAAFVVAIGPPKPSIIELKIHCAKALPAYMAPDYFVFLDSLPRTSSGKADYQGLQAMAQARI